ncbi:MBL fold metallo-hydrolase [Amycolatopsis jejuensis]|uniref:MBL fold metallo-hydrolase n=1 Tax=Amycolatopsis jejuensis TaxID=330084 RepID=UPI000524EAE2|nr:MBL fold metallo-hydrolase [Amycolatopsis jejuensis]
MSSTTSHEYAAPVVQGDPVQVAGNVFVIPDRRVPLVPNVGIVVGDRAALVIDTGAGPRNGEFVLDHARRLAPGRRLYLTVTQLDPGHGFGAQAFDGVATIIYSTAQRARLLSPAQSYADAFRTLGPAVSTQLDGLRLAEPDVTYDTTLDLDLGGVHARLAAWGPAHTLDDTTVTIDDRVVFTGDLFETRMFPILPYFPPFDTGFDGPRWLAALDRLIAAGPSVVVPGHGEVTDAGLLGEVREYLRYVQAETQRLRAAGVEVEAVGDLVEPKVLARWPDWEVPQWIRYAVRAFYANDPH